MVLKRPRHPGDTLPPPQVTQASSTLVTMETIALRGCSPLVSVTTMSSPKSQKSCLKWGEGNGVSQGTRVSRTPKRVPDIQGTPQKGPRGPGDPVERAQVPGRPYRRGPSIQETP